MCHVYLYVYLLLTGYIFYFCYVWMCVRVSAWVMQFLFFMSGTKFQYRHSFHFTSIQFKWQSVYWKHCLIFSWDIWLIVCLKERKTNSLSHFSSHFKAAGACNIKEMLDHWKKTRNRTMRSKRKRQNGCEGFLKWKPVVCGSGTAHKATVWFASQFCGHGCF